MAAILIKIFLLYIILLTYNISPSNSGTISEGEDSSDTYILKPNEQTRKENDQHFIIFCFISVQKSILQIYRSVDLLVEHAPQSYDIVTGENASEVRTKYNTRSMWNPSTWLSAQKNSIDFPAFSNFCVGIETREKYVLYLKVRVVNYWKVLQTVIGILLFLCAPSLSRNSFFHYTSGVSVGVFAALLILVFIVGRIIPKKSASYAVMIFGYSLILYILQILWQQFNNIITNYMNLLLLYCLTAAFISFLACYRYGPVENVRTFNIIQWCMQAISLILIYLGSEYREVSAALIIILVIAKSIPTRWISKGLRLWYRLFPPKIKLLTEVEYIEQGSRETAKALEELRKFCSSPDCNTWKVVRQLNDPLRFSKFIESGSHYTDDELLRYNSEGFDDDEDDLDSDTANSSNSLNNGYGPSSSYRHK